MKVTGTLIERFDTVEVSDSFKKRDIVVKTDDQYPQEILIQFVQDKTTILDNFEIGDTVEVSINLRGRSWTSPQGEVKYFNTVEGWRITGQGNGQQPAPQEEVEF